MYLFGHTPAAIAAANGVDTHVLLLLRSITQTLVCHCLWHTGREAHHVADISCVTSTSKQIHMVIEPSSMHTSSQLDLLDC